MISLSGLNDKQREAALQVDGPVLILAGAGSGKTRTITYRVAHMVDNLQIPGKNILALSFTNKAAREMRERVHTLLGKARSKGLTLTTFHSLGVRILKKEIEKLGYHKRFSIYDTSDQMGIIRQALKHFHAEKKFDGKVILSKIGTLKNHGISPDDFPDSAYFDDEDAYDHATQYCYHFYQEKLMFFNAIDFDDILYLTVKLFKEHPEVAKEYSHKFKYIMIDEYQDTNQLQFDLVLGLTSTHNNLCVVGDDDQAIYSFRGADISNILNYEKNFEGAKVIKLEENYRSTTPILDFANKVIIENKNRRDKTLWTQNHDTKKPILWEMADTDHESQIITEEIVQHQAKGGHLGDIAILYRSNTQAGPIEEELRISQVPYQIIGGQKFLDKKEVKDLVSYLTLLQNQKDQIALRRILNVPARGIGNRTLEKYLEVVDKENISLFDALVKHPDMDSKRTANIEKFIGLINRSKENFKNYPLPVAISMLIEEIHFLEYIQKSYDNPKQAKRRCDDIMFFIESAERYVKYNGTHATLRNFLEKVLLQDQSDINSNEDEEEDTDIRKNQVTLMTLHSSKGLEFDTVYLLGAEEETIPHKRTITMGEDISEERRLFYVGITRAQRKFVMTVCKERKLYGKEVPRHPTRFLGDLLDKGLYIKQDRTTFGHMTEEEVNDYKKDFFSNLMDSLD